MITTPHLTLRPFADDDLVQLAKVPGDPKVMIFSDLEARDLGDHPIWVGWLNSEACFRWNLCGNVQQTID